MPREAAVMQYPREKFGLGYRGEEIRREEEAGTLRPPTCPAPSCFLSSRQLHRRQFRLHTRAHVRYVQRERSREAHEAHGRGQGARGQVTDGQAHERN